MFHIKNILFPIDLDSEDISTVVKALEIAATLFCVIPKMALQKARLQGRIRLIMTFRNDVELLCLLIDRKESIRDK